MATTFRPPRQWVLTEDETINSFASWQSNLKYYLSLNNDFAPYLTANWQKSSVAHHGLTDDPAGGDDRKTAAQKAIVLDRMLGIVAQYSPSLLRNDILKKSTSLASIWTRIRKYYSFQQSEINFLKLSKIPRKEGERYETLFQRILAHLEDNLLTVESGIIHDGAAPTENEVLSPTAERLAVYIWMNLVDSRLPDFVARQYAHDLQTKSIKEIQPMIVDNMESLLAGIAAEDDVQISYTRSNSNRPRSNAPFAASASYQGPSKAPAESKGKKSCVVCKLTGRRHEGHDLSSCWHLSKMDRLAMAKTLKLEVNDLEDEEVDDEILASQTVDLPEEGCEAPENDSAIRRVKCSRSPVVYMYYLQYSCRCLIDTGGQSSLVSQMFVQRAKIKMSRPTQGATQLDKTPVPVLGEVHITLSYGQLTLPLDALVVDVLDTDILLGVPFCEENDITVHLGKKVIDIQGLRISYNQPGNARGKSGGSTILRNTVSTVVYPGEFLEVDCGNSPDLDDGVEVSIEPHIDSPDAGAWPSPVVSRVVNYVIRIPNNTDSLVKVSKSQHVAVARRLITPSDVQTLATTVQKNISAPSLPCSHSSLVVVDPNNQLTQNQRDMFATLHQRYDSVFDPKIGLYNDHSGPVRAHVDIGPVKPRPRKTKIPSYSTELLQELQSAADELEELGVLQKPEDLGIIVQHASPSLLLREGPNKRRLVTTFNDLSPYIRIPPTSSSDCNSVLRKLSKWKYVIKTDMKKAYFQIPLDKESMQYVGTVTPFKGLRVYTRPPMGLPGSGEYLQELLSRVLGEEMHEGFVLVNADDMYVCGNEFNELFSNWSQVLEKMHLNNLKLNGAKTVVCVELEDVAILVLHRWNDEQTYNNPGQQGYKKERDPTMLINCN